MEPDQLIVWTETLGGLPADAVQEAAQVWMRTQPRFPTPAQLIDATNGVLRRRASRPALGEAPLTPEERQQGAENARKIKAMLADIKKHTSPPWKATDDEVAAGA